VICRTLASRNHGNSAKGTKSSSPLNKSQKPNGDIFETSTSEVFSPSASDFIGMYLHKQFRRPNLPLCKTVVICQRYRRLQPEFGLAIRTLHMNMHTGFFTREKVKPIAAVTEYRGTHRYRPNLPSTPANNSSIVTPSFAVSATRIRTVGLYEPRSSRPTTLVCIPASPASASWLNFFSTRNSRISSPKLRKMDLERTAQESNRTHNTV
jgi:hypothetical protein